MNVYPNEIFDNHLKKFLSKNLLTANSCQNMNNIEEIYCHVIYFYFMTFFKLWMDLN